MARRERYAVIDVGTNSVKFHVGERGATGRWGRVVDRAELTRLGEGLEATGEIAPAALERTATAIAAMVEEAADEGALAIAAVGTAGLRIARNRDEVIAEIRHRTGVRIDVIPGEEESRLAYLAVKVGLGLAEGALVVFDTGGGSSQFTFGRGGRVDERFSVDVGAVRYTERFGLAGAVTPEVLAGCPGGDLHRPGTPRRPDGAGRPRRHGRCDHQHDGREARHGNLRPRHRPGHRAGPRRDRPADPALPDP